MDVIRHLVRYNSQTCGIEKLCRLLQYSCQLCRWTLQLQNDLWREKLQALELSMSETCRVLCMGKSIDTIKSAIDNMEVDDVMLRTLLIAGKVSQACQLLLDNYIWIASLGRVSVDTKPLVKLASRFSFLALVFRLARNVYDIVRIVNASSRQAEVREKSLDCSVREKSLDCSVREKSLTMLTSNGCVRHGLLNCVLLRRRQVFVDVAKNLLDIPLALSGIAALRLSEGSRGLLGVVSSYLSVLVVWNPALKLIPS